MKKTLLILIIAAAHFTLSKLVPVLTLLLMDTGVSHLAVRILTRMMIIATRVLYFPMLTVTLYPRPWFPGYWINAVIFFNSLLWAVVIFFMMNRFRKFYSTE